MAGPTSDHVTLSISADSVNPTRAGFGKAMIASANASFPERLRWYDDLSGIVDDGFATTSPEYLAAQAYFSQDPCPEQVAIGRCALPPTMVYTISVITALLGNTYGINVAGEGVTATEVRYTALADLVYTTTHASETHTSVAHGMATGDGPYRLTNSGGALPAGTAVDTNYWIIRLTADTFQLADTYADAIALDPTLISGDGTGTHTLRRSTNDVITAQLVDRLNSVAGKNYTAAQVTGAGETDSLTVTATAAGDWFSLECLNPGVYLKTALTHVDPGIATDLAAIATEDDTWYGLITLYNSSAYVAAAAAWVEAQSAKQYAADVVDSETISLAVGGGDTADDLFVAGYAQTSAWYHPSPADMLGSALWGKFLPYDPGAATAKFKTLAGVSAVTLTATQRVNLRAKKANSYESVAGVSMTWEGTTADGDFVDAMRDLHWLNDEVSVEVFTMLATLAKLAYTDEGVATLKAAIRAALGRAVTAGVLAATPEPTVTAPRVSTISSANRAARFLPDVKFTGTRTGAVHKAALTGVVSV